MSAQQNVNHPDSQISGIVTRLDRLEKDFKCFKKENAQKIAERIDVLKENNEKDYQRLNQRMDELIESNERDHSRFDKRFDKVDERFDKVDERFDKIDEKFDKIDEKFDKIDDKFDKINERFIKLEEKMDRKIDGLKGDLKLMVGLFIGFTTIITVIQHLLL